MADSRKDLSTTHLPDINGPEKGGSRRVVPLAARLTHQIPKPKDWQAFQSNCVFLFRAELNDPHAGEYGRSGQGQSGIDLIGRRDGQADHYVGIQCRHVTRPLRKAKILSDCRDALTMGASLKEIIFATTAPNSTRATAAAIEVEKELRAEGYSVTVALYGWEDLQLRIAEHPTAYAAFFPTFEHLDDQGIRGLIERYKEAMLGEMTSSGAAHGWLGSDIRSLLELRALEDIETKLPDQPPPQDQLPTVKYVREWIGSSGRLVLTGHGGAGKTTTLHWLCYHFSSDARSIGEDGDAACFPILVRLGSFHGDLEDLILKSARRLDDAINREVLQRISSLVVPVVLLDEFDECPNQRRLLKELRRWADSNSRARVVLASRPLDSPLGASFRGWVRLSLHPLTDDEILSLFTRVLGSDRADALIALLDDRGLLNAFRLPLLALLAAEAARGTAVEAAIYSTGRLYEQVLTQILESADAQRGENLDAQRITSQRRLLALIAKLMARHSSFSVPLDRVISSASKNAAIARNVNDIPSEIRSLAALGLLSIASSSVSFTHASFRDFFVAQHWLQSGTTPSALGLIRRPLQPDACVFWLSLADENIADAFLHRLLSMVTALKPLLGVSIARIQGLVYLTLLLLSESGPGQQHLKDRFLAMAANRPSFMFSLLPQKFAPIENPPEDRLANYFFLIGKLRTDLAFRFLTTRSETGWPLRRYKIFGLLHFRSQKALQELLEGLKDPHSDGIADGHTIRIVAHFPVDLIQEEIRRRLVSGDFSFVRTFLNRLSTELAFAGGNRSRAADPNRLAYSSVIRRQVVDRPWWLRFLFELFVNADDAISKAARSAIVNLSWGAPMLPSAEEEFIHLTNHASAAIRVRAVHALLYVQGETATACVESSLRDSDAWVVFEALNVLWIKGRKRFGSAMVEVLNRFPLISKEKVDALNGESDEKAKIRSALSSSGDGEILLLGVAALCHTLAFFRSWSGHEILRRDRSVGIQVCHWQFDHDEDDEVKSEALVRLISASAEEAAILIITGLNHPGPQVRNRVIANLLSIDRELARSFDRKLMDMALSDSSRIVRDTARIHLLTLDLIKVGSKEWQDIRAAEHRDFESDLS